MTTMGVTVYCNRVQINGDQEQLMLLRTLQDNESNILGNHHTIAAHTKINSANNILTTYDPSRLKKHGKNGQPPPVAVAKRNARERNRVKQVNNGFATLRQHIPSHIAAGYGDRGKKLSKVETLRMAVEYIRGLQRLLMDADGIDYDTTTSGSSSADGNTLHSPDSVVSSHNGSVGERLIAEDDDNVDEDRQQEEDKETMSNRFSPSILASASPRDYYSHSTGDEENLEPLQQQQQHQGTATTSSGLSQNFSNLSPSSLASPVQTDYYNQNEENVEPRILSPYSGAGDSEEGGTIYAASPEAFSGALYYKQEITESGEFMDVVSWWEQEQGRLVHHTQPHAQRLAHV